MWRILISPICFNQSGPFGIYAITSSRDFLGYIHSLILMDLDTG